MAIAYDTSTYSSGGPPTNTFSHTTSAGANVGMLLFVGISNPNTVSGATYNGTTMTLLASSSSLGTNTAMYVYYLLGPTSGAHNCVVTSSGGGTEAMLVTYTGVYQIGFPDNYIVNSGSIGAGSVYSFNLLTTTADRCLKVVGCYFPQASADSGSTGRYIGSFYSLLESNTIISPAGTHSMDVKYNGGGSTGVGGYEVSIASLDDRTASVYDSLSISEDLSKAVTAFFSVFDTITISESHAVFDTLRISVNDSISVSEHLDVKPPLNPFNILIYEPIEYSENLLIESFRFSPGRNKPNGQVSTTPILGSATYTGSPAATASGSL